MPVPAPPLPAPGLPTAPAYRRKPKRPPKRPTPIWFSSVIQFQVHSMFFRSSPASPGIRHSRIRLRLYSLLSPRKNGLAAQCFLPAGKSRKAVTCVRQPELSFQHSTLIGVASLLYRHRIGTGSQTGNTVNPGRSTGIELGRGLHHLTGCRIVENDIRTAAAGTAKRYVHVISRRIGIEPKSRSARLRTGLLGHRNEEFVLGRVAAPGRSRLPAP